MNTYIVVTYCTVQSNHTSTHIRNWQNNENITPRIASLGTRVQNHFYLNTQHKYCGWYFRLYYLQIFSCNKVSETVSVAFLMLRDKVRHTGWAKILFLITNIYYKKTTWNKNTHIYFFSKCNSTQEFFLLQHISTLQYVLLLLHGERLIDNQCLSTCSPTCLQLL